MQQLEKGSAPATASRQHATLEGIFMGFMVRPVSTPYGKFVQDTSPHREHSRHISCSQHPIPVWFEPGRRRYPNDWPPSTDLHRQNCTRPPGPLPLTGPDPLGLLTRRRLDPWLGSLEILELVLRKKNVLAVFGKNHAPVPDEKGTVAHWGIFLSCQIFGFSVPWYQVCSTAGYPSPRGPKLYFTLIEAGAMS